MSRTIVYCNNCGEENLDFMLCDNCANCYECCGGECLNISYSDSSTIVPKASDFTEIREESYKLVTTLYVAVLGYDYAGFGPPVGLFDDALKAWEALEKQEYKGDCQAVFRYRLNSSNNYLSDPIYHRGLYEEDQVP